VGYWSGQAEVQAVSSCRAVVSLPLVLAHIALNLFKLKAIGRVRLVKVVRRMK
jgi:hypothetical protein